jgi:DNA polymerase-1
MNDVLGLSVVKEKKTKQPTTGKQAAEKWRNEIKVLRPFLDAVTEVKPLRTFLKNFGQAPLDSDGRIRCYYNVAGTDTFRFTSSESAFDTGTNLENVPKGDRSKTLRMPNMRRPFVADDGMEQAEIDLAGADAQVVAWEANDPLLKQWFREGIKIHAITAKEMFGSAAGLDGKREPYYTYAKAGRHLSNYRGKPRTLSVTLGLTVHEAEKFQAKLFSMHPGILKWHERVDHELNTTRAISNRFGFRKYYFDRLENCVTGATAWNPQSTVAIVVNRALCNVDEDPSCRGVQILLQTHDSFNFQYPIERRLEILRAVKKVISIPVPFPDPLIIPFTLATGPNWGDLEKADWPSE